MVIFSDGESTRGGDFARSVEAIRVAQELGTALCPVKLAPPPGGRKRHKIEVIFRSKNRGEIVGGFRALVH